MRPRRLPRRGMRQSPLSPGRMSASMPAVHGDRRVTVPIPGVLRSSLTRHFATAPDPSAINGTAVAASGTGTVSSRGLTGGFQAGYNWQRGSLVFGGEADVSLIDLNATATANGTFPFAFLGTAYTVTERISANWLATIRGRLGVVATPQLLLYATGGVAVTSLTFSSTYTDNAIDPTFPGGTGFGSRSEVKVGWTLGAGGEWMLDSRWSFRGEYLYVDFGSMDVAVQTSNTAAFTQTITVNAHPIVHIARVGLNYRN